jgi:hypothetical protein
MLVKQPPSPDPLLDAPDAEPKRELLQDFDDAHGSGHGYVISTFLIGVIVCVILVFYIVCTYRHLGIARRRIEVQQDSIRCLNENTSRYLVGIHHTTES